MTTPEKRSGWGKPVLLTAEEADAARDLVTNTRPGIGTKESAKWSILASVLIPPVEACKPNRKKIEIASDWIGGIDVVPDVYDPDYDEFESEASQVLLQAVRAYECRPTGCEMTMSGDNDCFECDRCNFDRTLEYGF
jgi:hypothetical protein